MQITSIFVGKYFGFSTNCEFKCLDSTILETSVRPPLYVILEIVNITVHLAILISITEDYKYIGGVNILILVQNVNLNV